MPDTDFAEVAEARVNKQIDGFDKIKSKEEYFDKLEDYLGGSVSGKALLHAKRRSWFSIREEMFEGSSAKDVVEKNELEVETAKSLALRYELTRKSRARLVDESRTARDTRPVSMRSYGSWRRMPGRFDLRGVDTRRVRSRRGLNVERARMRLVINSQDARLRNYRVFINPANRVKQYRSLKGRFVPNPFRRKKIKS